VVNDGFESRRLAFEKARARVATPTAFGPKIEGYLGMTSSVTNLPDIF
jgi:hypothetical protein